MQLLLTIVGMVIGAQSAEMPYESSIMNTLIDTLAQRHLPPKEDYYGGFSEQKQGIVQIGNERRRDKYDEDIYPQNQNTNQNNKNHPVHYVQIPDSIQLNRFTNFQTQIEKNDKETVNLKPEKKFCSGLIDKPSHEIKPANPSLPFLPVVIYNMGPISNPPIIHQDQHVPQNYKPSVSSILESLPLRTPTRYNSENADDSVVIEEDSNLDFKRNDQENNEDLLKQDHPVELPISKPIARIRRRIN